MFSVGLLPEADGELFLPLLLCALAFQGLACPERMDKRMCFTCLAPQLATPSPHPMAWVSLPVLRTPQLVPTWHGGQLEQLLSRGVLEQLGMAFHTRNVVLGFLKLMWCHVWDLASDHLLQQCRLGLTCRFTSNKGWLWVVSTLFGLACKDVLVFAVHSEPLLAGGTLDTFALGNPCV